MVTRERKEPKRAVVACRLRQKAGVEVLRFARDDRFFWGCFVGWIGVGLSASERRLAGAGSKCFWGTIYRAPTRKY